MSKLLVVVGPHVIVAVGSCGVGARCLEPRVLVAGVVHDEVDDDAHAPLVGAVDEFHEVGEVPEFRQDRGVVGDVVTAVADAIAVAVLEGPDEDLVEDGAFEPVGVTVLGRRVLEGVLDGLVEDHGVGDPPICGEDGRRTSTCAGRRPGSRRT